MRRGYFIVTSPIRMKCGPISPPNLLRYKSSPNRTVSPRLCCVTWNFEGIFNHFELVRNSVVNVDSIVNSWIAQTPFSLFVIQPWSIEIMRYCFSMTMLRRHTLPLSSKQQLSSCPELNFFFIQNIAGSDFAPPSGCHLFRSMAHFFVPKGPLIPWKWYLCRIEQLTQRWTKVIKTMGYTLKWFFYLHLQKISFAKNDRELMGQASIVGCQGKQ